MLILFHFDLSVIALIGIILLIGIVKKNGIMMVDFAINAERKDGMSPHDSIRQACLLRFRPILMTTMAALLSGLPLMLGSGAGSELRQPLGYAMPSPSAWGSRVRKPATRTGSPRSRAVANGSRNAAPASPPQPAWVRAGGGVRIALSPPWEFGMRGLLIPALALAATQAFAQPVTGARFAGTAHVGTAHVGTAMRAVTFRLSCALDRTGINNIAIELDVPDAEQLQPGFDTDRFEGPDGQAAKIRVVAAVAAARAQIEFGSTGSYGNNGAPATTFTFSAAFTPGPGARAQTDMQRLQAVAELLGRGPGHLDWRIDNPAKGMPLEASADLSAADAGKIRAAMTGCRAKSPSR